MCSMLVRRSDPNLPKTLDYTGCYHIKSETLKTVYVTRLSRSRVAHTLCQRMDPRLDGILFRRKPKRIIAHRMQNIEPAQYFISRQYIRRNISECMPHMKPGSRRVGEHIQDIKFGLVAPIFYLISAVFLPIGPLFLLDLAGFVLHILFAILGGKCRAIFGF